MTGMAMARRFIGLTVMAAALLALFCVSPAGARELVEFEKEATLTANGPIPPVPAKPLEEAKEVCGSETEVFGSELLSGTPPSKIKVKNEWHHRRALGATAQHDPRPGCWSGARVGGAEVDDQDAHVGEVARGVRLPVPATPRLPLSQGT